MKTNPAPLTGTCDTCGKPGTLSYMGAFNDYRCPACLRREALHTAALDQLELMTRATVETWLATWSEEFPGLVDVSDLLRQVGLKLSEEIKEGSWTPGGHVPQAAQEGRA